MYVEHLKDNYCSESENLNNVFIEGYMGISKVIKKSTYNIQCFFWRKWLGKVKFNRCISYFYLNLQSDEMGSQVVFDKRNPYSQKVII